MNKCANCAYTTETNEKFCPECGGEIVAEVTADARPIGNALPITGMIFSIVGLHNSLTMLLVNAVFFIAGGYYFYPVTPTLCSITGFILSVISAKRGNKTLFTRLGTTFSIIGLIVAVLHTLCLILYTLLVLALLVVSLSLLLFRS